MNYYTRSELRKIRDIQIRNNLPDWINALHEIRKYIAQENQIFD